MESDHLPLGIAINAKRKDPASQKGFRAEANFSAAWLCRPLESVCTAGDREA